MIRPPQRCGPRGYRRPGFAGRAAWAAARLGGVHESQSAPVTQPRRGGIAGRLELRTSLSSIQLFGLVQQAVSHVVPLQRPLKLVVFMGGEIVG